ncbi:MAG: hypothetical protein PHQ26_07835 [Bacteroidales bacterium]|nr:hypothetical protein [Bacteroidales bacterium]MDD4771371.1 hypothetical protein [Bacteroidales bacterium]
MDPEFQTFGMHVIGKRFKALTSAAEGNFFNPGVSRPYSSMVSVAPGL